MSSRRRSRVSRALTIVFTAITVLILSRIPATKGVGARPVVMPPPNSSGPSFTAFESGQVRPLALSPHGDLLFATNTPDNRLEIFSVSSAGIQSISSVVVGLEPVAVAAASETEVWVVNHLSDSISIVSLAQGPQLPRVTRTLLVGDEPRDIVFAGPGQRRAFITTAHRGQNNPNDPGLLTPGLGRADVWVFDADNLGSSLGGTPLNIVTLFTDTPRALAVTPDGSRVYAAGFQTGNQTATIPASVVQASGGSPSPTTNFAGVPAPQTGLIVKYRQSPSDGTFHWLDETGRIWDSALNFNLPDNDVFAIDALANPPATVPGAAFSHVGTTLFNMTVNPVNGNVYVSNLESMNQNRFAGPGAFAGHSVRGHIAESRITILNQGGVTPRHLNKHIDYSSCCAPSPNVENAKSLAFPTGMAVTSDGTTLYVAALGSSKLGVYDTAALENDTFVPDTADQISLTGGGPTGVVLDETNGHAYVMTRFDNSISVVDTMNRSEIGHVAMYNPEPASIVNGRPFLYDAALSSSHGDSACASCHIFGDFDSLAWDLGNPDASLVNIPGPSDNALNGNTAFHPMKGPMTTLSLRGMANHGPMNWRGDATGGNDAPSSQPDSGTFDENAAFLKLNQKFTDVLGRNTPLTPAQMHAFADFILQVTYPPNPIQALDNSLTPDQQAGHDFFFQPSTSTPLSPATNCTSCHALDPNANAQFGVAEPGFFGSDGQYSYFQEPMIMKNPHLRNQYQKVGRFGNSTTSFTGDQVRGFGFSHDGTIDTEFSFLSNSAFDGFAAGPSGNALRNQVANFLLVFPSNLKPIVGQQITLTADSPALVQSRIDLLVARAGSGECDLVAKARVGGGRERGFLYTGTGQYLPDQSQAPALSDSDVRAIASSPLASVTFTCTPPGSGVRIGIDRNLDGILDGDDPANLLTANISVAGYSGTYDGNPHGATGSATSLAGESLNPLLHLGTQFTDVPGGTATWTFDGNADYKPAGGTVPIVINPAALTVTANSASRYFGAPNPMFTGSVSGIVSADAHKIGVSYTTTATPFSPLGTYPITPVLTDPNGRLSNYSPTLKSGTLTVGILYAAYATSTGCNALTLSGSSFTDSYDSAGGYTATKSATGSDVAVNGSTTLSGSAVINGTLYTVHPTQGSCNSGNGVNASGKATATGGYAPLMPITFIAPPAVIPGTGDQDIKSNTTLPPGNYGNIKLSGKGVLTLKPGVYNINSIALSGNSQVLISPPGLVTLNIAGVGNNKPVDFSGGSVGSTSGIPSNLMMIYAGTGQLSLASSAGVVYAPNAAATLSGGTDWFGALVVNTLNASGGSAIHYDRELAR